MITIFFSWQSDIPQHRNILQKALNKAASQIGGVYIDTATRDEVGAVKIDDKILEKIENCNLMVADLSIIGRLGKKRRSSPNPNVIYETGYALGLKGEKVLYLVAQKSADGSEKFPFDLRNRQLAFYDFADTTISDVLTEDFKKWIRSYSPVSEDLHFDIYAEVGSISSNGDMTFYFTNEENEPYYLENMLINKTEVPISRLLKGKDNASISMHVSNYPFEESVNNFSFLVSRKGLYFRIFQSLQTESRADGKFNLSRIIPKIDKIEIID